jgi:hypothetical protein
VYQIVYGNSGNVDAFGGFIEFYLPDRIRCLGVKEGATIVWPDTGYWVAAPDTSSTGPVVFFVPFLQAGEQKSLDFTLLADPTLADCDKLWENLVIEFLKWGRIQLAITYTTGAHQGKLEEYSGRPIAPVPVYRNGIKYAIREIKKHPIKYGISAAIGVLGTLLIASGVLTPYGVGVITIATTLASSAITGDPVIWTRNLRNIWRQSWPYLHKATQTKPVNPVRPIDPNEKVGPSGSEGLARYIHPAPRINYTVFFENVDSASAPAETIIVTDRLDDDLDWSTLTLENVSHPAVCTTLVDSAMRTITWWFRGINLPPNQKPPEGEGWCRFNIMPKSDLPTGSEIKNYATIIFDVNPPMNTDTVLNTIDAGLPNSLVRALPETTTTGEFAVRWTGQDDYLGSGIRCFDIYVKTDAGPYMPWLLGTTDTMATFVGTNESRHYFYSIATDNVGWTETPPDSFDAYTFVNGVAPPLLLSPEDTSYLNDSTPTFVWSKTVGPGGTYKLQYAFDSLFTQGLVNIAGLSETTYTIPDVSALSDSIYYWRVEAYGRLGTPSGYRGFSRFILDTELPGIPFLLSPQDSAVIDDSTPTFIWSSIPDAYRYYVEYATDTLFDSLSLQGLGIAYDTTFTVPNQIALSDSTYYWHIQAIDVAGNYGGFQIHPFSFAISQFRSISGEIEYYRGTQGAVPDANVVISGAINDTTLTDSTGYYQFTDLPSLLNYTVGPYKINPTRLNAVSSYDAALILRHVVGMITLDSLQRIAADVSGNGTISSFDAAQVLQYVVGIRNHFPVGHRPGQDTVDWAFRPPSRTYDTLRDNQINQDYRAILYGDPSGNWAPSDFMSVLLTGIDKGPIASFFIKLPETEVAEIKVAIPKAKVPTTDYRIPNTKDIPETQSLTTSPKDNKDIAISNPTTKPIDEAKTIIFPVEVKGVKGLYSADIQVSYNPRQLRPIALRNTEITKSFMMAGADYGGIIRIGLAGCNKLDGDLRLLEIVFEVANNTNENELNELKDKDAASSDLNYANSSNIKIDWLIVNEGSEKPIAQGAMGKETKLPTNFYLAPPKPNPFGTGTCISYGLPQTSDVKLCVFDASGSLVKNLVETSQPAGYYSIIWNGKDNANRQLANGIYFIRMQADKQKFLRKVILLQQ